MAAVSLFTPPRWPPWRHVNTLHFLKGLSWFPFPSAIILTSNEWKVLPKETVVPLCIWRSETGKFLSKQVENGEISIVKRKRSRGPFFESRELFWPEKLVVKLQYASFENLIFLHVFNIRDIKRIAKFEGLEPRRCEDIKGIVVPERDPKTFGTFEKQAPDI